MAKLLHFDSFDEKVLERPPDDAEKELVACLSDLYPCMASFAKAFPGLIAIGIVGIGESYVIAAAPCRGGAIISDEPEEAVEVLADVLAYLPHLPDDDLQAIFNSALKAAKTRRRREDAKRIINT
jgi:hypothetical protein